MTIHPYKDQTERFLQLEKELFEKGAAAMRQAIFGHVIADPFLRMKLGPDEMHMVLNSIEQAKVEWK